MNRSKGTCRTSKTFRSKSWPVLKSIILWTGALAGLIVSISIVCDRITRPSPPDLVIDFSWTQSPYLTVAPALASPYQQWTDPFPMDIRVRNVGGTAARGVVLRIVHDDRCAFEAPSTALPVVRMIAGDAPRTVTSLALGVINPGQSFETGERLRVRFSNTLQILGKPLKTAAEVDSARHVPPDSSRLVVGVDLPGNLAIAEAYLSTIVTRRWEVLVSAENLREQMTSLFITVGPDSWLRESKYDYYRLRQDPWAGVSPQHVAGTRTTFDILVAHDMAPRK